MTFPPHHPIPWCDGVTQPFGAAPEVYAVAGMRGHNGCDFAAPIGTPVHSVEPGHVVHAGPGDQGPWAFMLGNAAGLAVLVHHLDKGIITGYAHLDSVTCTPGDALERGELVGLSGATGWVGGPHLHFEVISVMLGGELATSNGYLGRVDPFPLLMECTL